MPTYEYECRKCGYVFEKFQKMTEKPVPKCPRCCGAVARLPGAGAGIIFRGSGFYATDYRSASYKEKEKGERQASGQRDGEKDEKQGAVGKKTDAEGKRAKDQD